MTWEDRREPWMASASPQGRVYGVSSQVVPEGSGRPLPPKRHRRIQALQEQRQVP
jgi:hypothetical protein